MSNQSRDKSISDQHRLEIENAAYIFGLLLGEEGFYQKLRLPDERL